MPHPISIDESSFPRRKGRRSTSVKTTSTVRWYINHLYSSHLRCTVAVNISTSRAFFDSLVLLGSGRLSLHPTRPCPSPALIRLRSGRPHSAAVAICSAPRLLARGRPSGDPRPSLPSRGHNSVVATRPRSVRQGGACDRPGANALRPRPVRSSGANAACPALHLLTHGRQGEGRRSPPGG